MRDRKTLVIAFILGSAAFIVPVGMLFSRGQVVETVDFHMFPSMVRPGQTIEAVWTDKTLRTECQGVVYRRFIGNGDTWVLNAVRTVHHANVGDAQTFHSKFEVPNIPHGTAVFHKDIKRWCNFFQEWLWPMRETQEATFEVLESTQGQR
jgi:hypothetical protein